MKKRTEFLNILLLFFITLICTFIFSGCNKNVPENNSEVLKDVNIDLREKNSNESNELQASPIKNPSEIVENQFYNESTKNIIGNSSSNIINSGFVTQQDNYMYYCNQNNDSPAIYRERLDGTNKTKLTDFFGSSLNVIEDYLYYINFDDNNKIYRTKIDGSQTDVVETSSYAHIMIYNKELYARRSGDKKHILLKMDLDGNNEKVICDELLDIFTISEDIIICSTSFKNQNYVNSNVLLLNLDGSLIKDIPISAIKILGKVNNELYFIDKEDNICKKINIETNEIVSVSGKNNIKTGNLNEDLLYLSDYSNQKIYIYNMDTNSYNPFEISGDTNVINIIDHWLYYWQYTGEKEPSGILLKDIKRINLDSLDIELVE